MAAYAILRPAHDDQHAEPVRDRLGCDDPEQIFALAAEEDHGFVNGVRHRCLSSAPTVASTSAGASAISTVCQKGGPRTTVASTATLRPRSASSRTRDAGRERRLDVGAELAPHDRRDLGIQMQLGLLEPRAERRVQHVTCDLACKSLRPGGLAAFSHPVRSSACLECLARQFQTQELREVKPA